MQTSEQINDLATALAKARKNFKPIRRDKTVKVQTKSGSSYSFAYAPIENILDAITGPLADEGLTLLQGVANENGHDVMVTTLVHASGQWVKNAMPVLVKDDGAQAYGSGCTYASRYGVKTLLVLATDEDDDGNAAEGNTMQPVARKHSPMPDPIQLSTTDAADVTSFLNSFVDTLNADIEEDVKADKMAALRIEANTRQHIYLEVWRLLDSKQRAAIKKYVEMADKRRAA